MIRIIVAGMVVAGLALGIWLLWPDADSASNTATSVVASPTTTTTVPADSTTSEPLTTTSTVDDSHVVETVEEAEEILRELWFGWFEGIYNQDEERIREVVATEDQVEQARAQFGVMEFFSQPMAKNIIFDESEILRSDDNCLAIWTVLRVNGFREGESRNLHVLRSRAGSWVQLGLWVNRNDLWAKDCESVLLSS